MTTTENPEAETAFGDLYEESEGTGEQNQGLIEARDRYRGERDSAREALTAAEARIERFQRAEVERIANEVLSHGSDLFTLSGNDIADYLTESGEVDASKVASDVAEILAERPGLRKPAVPSDPTQGRGGENRHKPAPTLADLLKQD